MHCFTHQDKAAIAICRACGKGLCPECGADTGRGLACRGFCEQEVRDYVELVDRGIKLHKQGVGGVSVIQSCREPSRKDGALTTTVAGHIQSTRRFRSSVAVFHCLAGMLMAAWGLSDIESFMFALVLGVCFLAYGIFGLVQARVASEAPPPQTKGTQTA